MIDKNPSSKIRIVKAASFLIVAVIILFSLTYVKELPLMQNYIHTQESSVNTISNKLSKILKTNPTTTLVTKPIAVSAGNPGVEGCGLTLQIASNKDAFVSGSEIALKLIIKNEGKLTCDQASISAFYSNNQSFISSKPKPAASNYYWKFGNLTPGASKTISLKTKYTDTKDDTVLNTEFCLTAHNSEDVCLTIELNKVTIPTSISEPSTENVEPFNPGSTEYGVWVWTSPFQMTATQRTKVISNAAAHNFNVIYLTIDDYLDIEALDEGSEKESQKKKYSDALEAFIIAANAKGISVDAEAGWRDWAEEGETYKGDAIITYAMEYNSTRNNKLRGVQFDVEPYLLPTYETNKAAVLKNFVSFVDRSTQLIGSSSLKLTIVIPHFYDSAQKWTPAVTYNGITTHTFDHLLRILDTRKNSSIILMSYRNFAKDANGSIEISQSEINTASTGNHSTTVIVAQETGNVEPDYVTFFGKSKAYFESQIALINQAFKTKSNFGGIAVHYLEPYLEL